MKRHTDQPRDTETNRVCRVVSGRWHWHVAAAYADEALRSYWCAPERLREPPAERVVRNPPGRFTEVFRRRLTPAGGTVYAKRYFAPGLWRGIKRLIRPSAALRSFRLALALERLGIPTAQPVAAGENRVAGWLRESWLITEEVPNARTWADYDRSQPQGPHRVPMLRALARNFAKLHDAGLSHSDANRNNLLVQLASEHGARVCLIDLDALVRRPLLTPRRAVKDLRRLLTRGPATGREKLWFLAEYCRARRNALSAHKLRRRLLACQAGDCWRRGGDFRVEQAGGRSWQVRSARVSREVEQIFDAPDRFLEQARILKPSRSSAVSARDGLVLKRYNLRKWGNVFLDLFRGSRAQRAFSKAYHLELCGVATARPIATADERLWFLPARSYFLMEEIKGALPLEAWGGDKRAACKLLAKLLGRMHREGFAHRDLKGGNVVFDDDGQPHLIDLDGLRFVRRVSDSRAVADLARLARDARGWQRRISRSDYARFLIAYCRARRLADWRWWWRAIGRRLL